jgi:hypothetical protein
MRGSGAATHFKLVGILIVLASAPAWSLPGAERAYETGSTPLDCRYAGVDGMNRSPTVNQNSPLEGVLLPEADVFRPILADQREPRFYADYRRVQFRTSSLLTEGKGNEINAGLVAFGGEFGLWGLRQAQGCNGLQISLFAAVFAQFNLDSRSLDLLNADYLVGLMLTYRRGPWSGRLRFHHQSSHLGDKFLLNYGLAHGLHPQHPSFEILDLLVSVEDNWWRLYGGGGFIALSKDPDLTPTPAFVEYGVELRGPVWARLRNSSLRPVFGAHFSDLQATGWSLSGSLEGGLEWASRSATHRIRALIVAQRGALTFSQFFFQKTQNVGLQLQFEF